MSDLRRVLKNTTYLTISELFIKAIGVVWIIILARSLSIVEYGLYNVVNAFIIVFSAFPDLGIGLITIREIAKNPKKRNVYLSNSLTLKVLLAIVTVLLILIVSFFFHESPEITKLVFIASLTLFFSTIRSSGIFYFDGTERMGYSAILNTLNTALLTGGGVMALFLGYGLIGVFTGMLIGTFLSTIITWFVLTTKFIHPRFEVDKKTMSHLMKDGLPLGLAGIGFLLYNRVDSVLLAKLVGVVEVGIYNAATPFVISLVGLLNVPFVVAVFPALTRAYSDTKRFKRAIKKSLIYVLAWSIPASLIFSLTAHHVIPMLFSERYTAAIPILRILIFVVPLMSMSALLYKILIVIGKQKYYLYVTLLGAVINILFNLILIPQFSIFGAVYASLATNIVVFLTYSILVYRFVKKV